MGLVRPWTRILGIDPGYRVTGFGVIDTNGQESRHVDSGVIDARKQTSTADRLHHIFAGVASVIAQHSPEEMAIERVFVARNADSALKLGQARAAAICASFEQSIPVHEYAAREVKKAIVGKGGAGKEQVEHMVRMLLGHTGELPVDASDALGIALCHAHLRAANTRLAEAMS